MKKKIIVIFSLFIVLFLLIINFYPYVKDNKCLNRIKKKLVTNIKAGDTISFNDELNCLQWDSIIFIPRDFEPKVIEKHTGVRINGYKLMGFRYLFKSDFYTYIAVLNNKKVVCVIETSGGVMIDDFIAEIGDNDLAIISKDDANFVTYLTNNKYTNGDKIYSIKFVDKNLIDKYKR